MPEPLERLQILEQRVAELADDLRELKRVSAIGVGPSFPQIRKITERVLRELGEARGIPFPDNSLDKMRAALFKAGALPRKIEVLVRTLQETTNAGSHYQEQALDESHLQLSEIALVALLEWHYRHKLPRRTWRDRWWKILIATCVVGGIVFLVSRDQQEPSTDGEWTYRTVAHEKLGYQLEVPAHFTESAPGPGNRTFTDGRASVIIVGRSLEGEARKEEICRQVRSLEGEAGVLTTWKGDGSTWCVSTGYQGTDTFYRRAAWKDGVVLYLVALYPTEGKAAYDAMISRIAHSIGWTR